MIVLVEDLVGAHTQHVRLFDRIMARLSSSRLDTELANGASPESSVALALRAELLARPSQLHLLACSVERLVNTAETPTLTSHTGLRVPIVRDAVRGARAELEALSRRLRSPGLVNVRGVARARLLLTDGTGPLYQSSTSRDLRAEVELALAQMDCVI